jgi:flagellar basal body-associated protein FliL
MNEPNNMPLQSDENTVSQTHIQDMPQPKKSKKKLIMSITVAVVLLLVAGVVFLLMNKDDRTVSKADTKTDAGARQVPVARPMRR